MKDVITLHFDGACEPFNPGGVAGCGFIIKEDKKVLKKGSRIVGSGKGMTNNIAEYNGLLDGIQSFLELNTNKKLIIYGDSDMVCRTISKEWGWNKKKTQWIPHRKYPELQKLAEKISKLLDGIDCEIYWVSRDENQEADMLSKELLTDEVLRRVEDTRKKCPKCGGYLIKRSGPYSEFYGCSSYPKCCYKEKLEKDNVGIVNTIGTKRQKIKYKEGDMCPKGCGGTISLVTPKITQKKLKRNYYYEKYLQCNKCRTMYLEEKYKVINKS